MKKQLNPILSVAISRIRVLVQQYQESEAISHAATKGSLREAYLKQFLAEIIPVPLKVGAGFVTDSGGQDVSPQVDLLVFDPTSIPAYSLGEFVTLVPIEAAILAIEVKSALKNSDFNQICRQQVSFRRLLLSYTTQARRLLTTAKCVGLPTMVVAFNATCARGTIGEWFRQESQLQAVCVVGKFSMLRDPRSGEVSTFDSDDNFAETLHLLALVHGLTTESARESRQLASQPTPDGPLDFYPDLGAYLTFDAPRRDVADHTPKS